MAIEYKSAGVDVEAGYKSVELMKKYVKATMGPNVVTDLGGFGGLFSIADQKWRSRSLFPVPTESEPRSSWPF